MTTYILLRDNKESPPLTLPELEKIGLLSSDQIWVEGQSVCWLNPDHFSELKPFIGLTPQMGQPVIPDIKPTWKEQPKKDPITEPGTEVINRFHRPGRNQYQIPTLFKKFGGYAALFIIGLTAGIIASKKTSRSAPISITESEHKSGVQIPDSNQGMSQPLINDETSANTENETQTDVAANQIKPDKNIQPLSTNYALKESTAVTASIIPPVANPAGTEIKPEESKEEPEIKEVHKPSIKELYSQVSVKNNDYDVGSFGGIKNLQLTVSNRSRYALDEVNVTVTYYKPMNEFLKSETVSCGSIAAGSAKTIPVPKSSRGIKVSCKISNIESKELMSSTAGL